MTGWWGGHTDGWGGLGVGGLVLGGLLLVALLLPLGWLLLRRPWSPPVVPGMPTRDTPGAREVLDARFARGDIDDEEYRRRRSVLEEQP